MLNRTTSSRRRRNSRSNASSPQARSPRGGLSPGRRASIAVDTMTSTTDRTTHRNSLAPEMGRSPRHSIIPDISLESRRHDDGGMSPPDDEPPPCRSPRRTPDVVPGKYVPEAALSPRNSLVPDASRSPRHSLTPFEYSRSPRNSLVPDSGALSPRNSLTPDTFNRSPRNSLVPEAGYKRHSTVASGEFSRSPRHSLTPLADHVSGSRLNLDLPAGRSPRNSLLPDGSRSPRQSEFNWTEPSPPDDEIRSVAARTDANRSPRGSIVHERISPRGSVPNASERSPRGSIGAESNHNRSPRESLAKNNLHLEKSDRSPRGSLTLTFHEPPAKDVRRYSSDNNCQRGKNTSPYKSARSGAASSAYNINANDGGSRRASSSVSQVSGDEQKRLCAEQNYLDNERGMGLTLATYGSVAYQLKDANLESNDTCEFIFKALKIFHRTVFVTVILVLLSLLPPLMLIMGIHFLRDCPRETHIPVYMIVGGSVGILKMSMILWNQLYTRRLAIHASDKTPFVSKVLSLILTLFLIAWFSLGNYWILRIQWPDYTPTLFEPNRWCDRTLYIFALVHLYIVYACFGLAVFVVLVLATCHICGCTCLGPATYK